MKKTVIKTQFSVFGKFNFPPTPEITISLLSLFQNHGLMPMVIQQLDVSTGQMQPRICLTKGQNLQIMFNNDRIDIIENFPSLETNEENFIARAKGLLFCLESKNLQFTRVALVKEELTQEIPHHQINQIRSKLLPYASDDSMEWSARWVNRDKRETEQLNVCLDIARVTGIFMNTPIGAFDGIKVLYDISTAQDNTSARFTSSNIDTIFDQILTTFEEQKALMHSFGE